MGTENLSSTGNKDDARPNEIIYCGCGCGKTLERFSYHYAPSVKRVVWYERRFIKGHRLKGRSPSAETRRKISEKLKGHTFSPETIEKIRKTQEKNRELFRSQKLGNKNPAKRLDVRLKMSLAQKGKKKGSKAWNWNGGKSYERGDDWITQRKLCYKRDKYICQDCGVVRSKALLAAHHLVGYRYTMNNHLDNLITLCFPCHGKRHGRGKDYPPHD